MTIQKLALSVSLLIFGTVSMFGQTTSSSILGTVYDPAGAVVPKVPVTIKNLGTSAENVATTDSNGLFRITNIFAGDYSVKVEAKGFKTLMISDINIGSGDQRDLGRLTLSLGAATESISVTAEAVAVQTATSDKTHIISTQDDLNVVAIKGRDMMSYMKLLPGVIDTNNGRDASGGTPLGSLTFSGNTGVIGYSVDGATDMDTGCANCFVHFEPNIDSISEIKVLTSNFAAEYGRNSGATIAVTTKSGTQQFHGSGWWTHRHEEFNANSFSNNQTGLARQRYRYNIQGWSFGGPVYIPGHFNKNKTKIFAFGSQEYTKQFIPATVQYRQMPTAAQRAGDFSQAFLAPTAAQNAAGQNGSLQVIKDPLDNFNVFPNNKIAPSRFNGWGLAMLNFFPLPNAVFAPGTSQFGQNNFQDAASGLHPRRNDILRVDVVATSKLNGFLRIGKDVDVQDVVYGITQFNIGLTKHPIPGRGIIGTINYTFSPTLVNQASYNYSYNFFSYYIQNPAEVARTLLNGAANTPEAGKPLPSLFPLHPFGPGPGGNLLSDPANCFNGYCNFTPNFSFGSPLNNAPSVSMGNQVDYVNTNQIKQFNDNISKVWGGHSLKFGLYMEQNRKLQPDGNANLGNYSFGPDSNNGINNTGLGFANALLGYYNTYNEKSAHQVYDVYYWNTEFYAQDDWRIGKRLTLNYGVRFYHMTPQQDRLNEFGYFVPANYKASTAPKFIRPVCSNGATTCTGTTRVGLNPVTNAFVPASQIGLYAPGGGDPADGWVTAGLNGVPLDTYTNSYIAPAPRIGFAYDVMGDGKTALRGGWGLFYDRLDGNQVYSMSGKPPIVYQPTTYYSSIGSLATTQGLFGPTDVTQWTGNTSIPGTQSASLGVQHTFWGTLVDVSYQGTFGLHRNLTNNLNTIPLGRYFDPAYTDPTNGSRLADVFMRTNFPGTGQITQRVFIGKSAYSGLQVSIKRRLSKGLLWTAAYTWSHSFALAGFDPLVPDNDARNWGPQGSDRRHVLQISYAYDLPKLGKALHSKPLGILTDGWNLSGVTSYSTGSPFTPGFSWSDNRQITGTSNENARIDVIGNPFANVPAGTPGLVHGVTFFNAAAFAGPVAYTTAGLASIGNAGINIMQGPGYANFDMTLNRKVNLHSEKRQLQFKIEAFNVFNHAQFGSVNSGFQFSAVTNQNTNTNIGALTGERGARILESEIRLQF